MKKYIINTVWFSIVIVLFFNTPIYSQNISTEGNIIEWNTITGDWGGVRTDLEESGIMFEAVYKSEVWGIKEGNVEPGTSYVDNVDLVLSMDFETLFGWSGAAFTSYFLGNNGEDPNEFVGSLQGVTNIAAPKAWKIYNLFLEQNLFDDRISILVGLFDYNSEFDVKESAGLFINPSHGIGVEIAQSGENGPSIFPTASLGLRLRAHPMDDIYIQSVILDGVPGHLNNPHWTHVILNKSDGVFLSTEAGYMVGLDDEQGRSYTKFAGGFWYYTESMDYIFTNISNWGVYGFFDKIIYQEANDPSQGLSVFGRMGVADTEEEPGNDIDYYVAGGLVYTGLIPSRDSDQLGFAISSGHNSYWKMNSWKEQYGANPVIDWFEHNIELTYAFQVTPAVIIQPNLQYYMSPADLERYENVLVLGSRLTLSF